jgi:hypothetical protein
MVRAFKTVVLMALLASCRVDAQMSPASSLPAIGGAPAEAGQQASNVLVLGTSTGVVYDSNALNSEPPVSDVQYTLYPLVGLRLARPRWDALISFVPGFSYSTANLPEYRAVSLKSNVWLQYRLSDRLSVEFANYLVSSSNPFDNFSTIANSGASTQTGSITNLNYLPKTNESATTDMTYSLSARTSLKILASYNYFDYQNNPNLQSSAQLFQQSNSTQVSVGLSRGLSPRASESFEYAGQMIDGGQGRVKTVGQSFQYAFQYNPSSSLRLSAAAGPEYVRSTYSGILGRGGAVNLDGQLTSGWTWTGNFTVSERFGKNQISASASRQLSMGNQYQGNVQQSSVGVGTVRQMAHRTELGLFGSYSVNTPVFIGRNIPRLSNNYFSSGTTLSKTIADRWTVSCSYWYLFQNQPQSAVQLYSGDHNRVAISLSYAITKALK